MPATAFTALGADPPIRIRKPKHGPNNEYPKGLFGIWALEMIEFEIATNQLPRQSRLKDEIFISKNVKIFC